jgi:hypothetical protein
LSAKSARFLDDEGSTMIILGGEEENLEGAQNKSLHLHANMLNNFICISNLQIIELTIHWGCLFGLKISFCF